MLTKLDQLSAKLLRHGLLHRAYVGIPADVTYSMDFEATVPVVIWNGKTEPVQGTALDGHIWFDGLAFQKRVNDDWVSIDTYEAQFASTLIFLGENYDMVNRFILSVGATGPKNVAAGRSQLLYTMTSVWSDGTTENLPARWSLDPTPPYHDLPRDCKLISGNNGQGNLSSGYPALDRPLTLVAKHGTHMASILVNVVGTQKETTSAAVVKLAGPLNIVENTAGTFVASVEFPDGTIDFPPPGSFKWSVSPPDLGTLSSTGVFTADNVPSDVTIIVRAELIGHTEIKAATKNSTIREATISELSAPFFGQGDASLNTASLLLALPGRGTAGTRVGNFSVKSEQGKKVYYCYPASMGVGHFTNLTLGQLGGFDTGVSGITGEPRRVSVPAGEDEVDFFVYESNASGMGACDFSVA